MRVIDEYLMAVKKAAFGKKYLAALFQREKVALRIFREHFFPRKARRVPRGKKAYAFLRLFVIRARAKGRARKISDGANFFQGEHEFHFLVPFKIHRRLRDHFSAFPDGFQYLFQIHVYHPVTLLIFAYNSPADS